MRRLVRPLIGLAALAALPLAALAQSKPAEPTTQEAQKKVLESLPFADRQDFADAMQGFVGTIPDALITGKDYPIWTMKPWDFLKNPPPDTANPALWRQGQLNAMHGLFKVTDRVYQLRGFDLANITIVEGDTGLILIDTLTTAEAAAGAMEVYYANRPKKPVLAVIYSHSHADHFGGVRGVASEEDVTAGKTAIIAPDGFMEHAIAENVIAGNAMGRRAQFMYGIHLPPGAQGHIDNGLGKSLSRGRLSLIAPTDLIKKRRETRVIDGVTVEFALTPGTEAPSEMNIYLPQFKVLDLAENVTHTMHNLYTLRGAEIRDGNAWSRYIDEALREYAGKSDVLVAQHHWPTFGSERIRALLAKQRDLYKFIHDQTVRLMNLGLTPDEIAEKIKLPKALASDWAVQGFYGTLKHNARGVYQKYLGWYDSNPANLDPLPGVEQAKKRLEYMGGAEAVLSRAQKDFAAGNYRFVASVLRDVVYAEPDNVKAKALQADALEQLGYQAISAPWRNEYLVAAMELRSGLPQVPATIPLNADTLKAISPDLFFDLMGVRLNAEKADGKKIVVNWTFSDLGETHVLNLENSVLSHYQGEPDANANVSLTMKRDTLNRIVLKETTFLREATIGDVKLRGNPLTLQEFMGLMEEPPPNFPIVTR
jgi:alkyl sulfatase BDS1-like metallo-beta-lactamase superfamily hydrolase